MYRLDDNWGMYFSGFLPHVLQIQQQGRYFLTRVEFLGPGSDEVVLSGDGPSIIIVDTRIHTSPVTVLKCWESCGDHSSHPESTWAVVTATDLILAASTLCGCPPLSVYTWSLFRRTGSARKWAFTRIRGGLANVFMGLSRVLKMDWSTQFLHMADSARHWVFRLPDPDSPDQELVMVREWLVPAMFPQGTQSCSNHILSTGGGGGRVYSYGVVGRRVLGGDRTGRRWLSILNVTDVHKECLDPDVDLDVVELPVSFDNGYDHHRMVHVASRMRWSVDMEGVGVLVGVAEGGVYFKRSRSVDAMRAMSALRVAWMQAVVRTFRKKGGLV